MDHGGKDLPQLKLYLLGPPCIELNGAAIDIDRRKTVGLLSYLAVTGVSHSREALATMLWPDYDTSRAYAYLRRSLWELNKALGEGWIVAGRDRVALAERPGFWLDVAGFQELLRPCRLDRVSPACLDSLSQAVKLYRGDFMAGFNLADSPAFDEWQFFQAEALRRELAGSLEKMAVLYGELGEYKTALTHAQRWLALDPLHEPAHRRLMLLYAQMGQRSAALRQYETCRQLLEKELGVAPQQETADLYEQIRSGKLESSPAALAQKREIPTAVAKLHSGSGSLLSPAPVIHLPAQLTPFVGRRQELDEISGLLEDPACRLLTLIGPGGIGKTRLGIQAAAEQEPSFSDGIYFVPLAPLAGPENIVPAIAKALRFNFYEEGGDPRQQLVDYLRSKELLLVLDNFEHLLVDESVSLPVDLLAASPGLKIMVTSRASLNLRGEQLYPVLGMRTPEGIRAWEDPQKLASYSSVQLFVQSARRLRPDFQLAAENLAPVAEICRLVEGMPLGIELAAAWIEMLSPMEIAAEIERSLDFLETEFRDVPARQRSIRAVFNASWSLLDPLEQEGFQRLSVFKAGFSRQAAESVAGLSLRALTGLANKSLLHRGPQDRYWIHELLRQYAGERLHLDQEGWRAVYDRHCAYYSQFLYECGEKMKGPGQKETFEAIDTEFENVRAAWHWAVEHQQFDWMDRMLYALSSYYSSRVLGQELEKMMDTAVQAIERPDVSERPVFRKEAQLLVAKMLAVQAHSLYDFVSSMPAKLFKRARDIVGQLGAEREMGFWYTLIAAGFGWAVDLQEAVQMLRRNLEDLRQGNDRWAVAYALQRLGNLLVRMGELEEARQVLSESIQICQEIGDRLGLAYTYGSLSEIVVREQAYDEATNFYRKSREIFEAVGDRASAAFLMELLASSYASAGEYEKAIQILQQCQEFFTEIGKRAIAAGMQSWESIYSLRFGDYTRARQLRLESLAVSQEEGDKTGIVWGHWELGEIERVEGNLAAARQLYQKSLDLFEENKLYDVYAFYHRGLGDIALAKRDFVEAKQRFQESLTISQERYHFWGICYALSGLGRAATGLGEYDEAWGHFRAAVAQVMDVGDRGLAMISLCGIASLLDASGQSERAVEIASFVTHHPASWQETKDQAARLLYTAAARLPGDALAAAQARGRTADFKALVGEFSAG